MTFDFQTFYKRFMFNNEKYLIIIIIIVRIIHFMNHYF